MFIEVVPETVEVVIARSTNETIDKKTFKRMKKNYKLRLQGLRISWLKLGEKKEENRAKNRNINNSKKSEEKMQRIHS